MVRDTGVRFRTEPWSPDSISHGPQPTRHLTGWARLFSFLGQDVRGRYAVFCDTLFKSAFGGLWEL